MITFKEFMHIKRQASGVIHETPEIDNSISVDSFHHDSMTLYRLKQSHSSATHLGNSYYHQGTTHDSHFYHLDANGDIDARSNIIDGIQVVLKKRSDVSSDVPHALLKHALDHHGRIESDAVHTKGSKKFWQSLPTHFPNAKFKLKNIESGKEADINPTDLKQNENKIWNSRLSRNLAIVIEK